MDDRTAEQAPIEQRRSSRFSVVVPVEVKWQEPSGKIVKEAAQAKEVNAQGGLLEMKIYPWVGGDLELTNLLSGQTTQARLVGTRRSKDGAFLGVAVALVVPNETFWGVNFQLRKACADLVKLEYEMRSGPIDQRVLREFRDAVDNVRKMAWAVQEWQERESRQQDPRSVLPLLTAERIHRATQLCDAIATAAAGNEIARETVGIEEFLRAVERVHQSLLDLFKVRPQG